MSLRKKLNGFKKDEFKRILDSHSSIVLISHTDMDGMCSVKSFMKSPYKDKVKATYFSDASDRSVTTEEEREIISINPSLILFMDLSPQNFKQLNALEKGRTLLVLDHHKPYGYENLPNLITDFHTYYSGFEHPDKYSVSFLCSHLLDLEDDMAEFSVSGLIGDNNYKHFIDYFELNKEKERLATIMGKLYKTLGALKEVKKIGVVPGRSSGAKEIQGMLYSILEKACSLKQLYDLYASSDLLKSTAEMLEKDYQRVLLEGLNLIKQQQQQSSSFNKHNLVFFKPKDNYVVSGFIYELEERIKQEYPTFKGTLIVIQETEDFYQLDGLSTDTEISAGEIFRGIGGGHRNVGGGVIHKSSNLSPQRWLEDIKERF
ncbi:MAG: hypothetical protein HQK49_08635 [Oligoflexia bacterium]|nr:hypothetical protein [Oligoflexia bacterium]